MVMGTPRTLPAGMGGTAIEAAIRAAKTAIREMSRLFQPARWRRDADCNAAAEGVFRGESMLPRIVATGTVSGILVRFR